jgi:hypothetical protein
MQKFSTRIFLTFALISAALSIVSAQENNLQSARRNLMPVPASVNWKTGRLPVTKAFTVAVRGQTDERLRKYIFRVMRRLEGRTILEFSRELSNDAATANLLIEPQSTVNAIPKLGDDES